MKYKEVKDKITAANNQREEKLEGRAITTDTERVSKIRGNDAR